MAKLRSVKFRFGNGSRTCYRGWTDGSTWNGWLNVYASPSMITTLVRSAREAGADAKEERQGLEKRVTTITVSGRKRRVLNLGRGYIAEECPPRRRR